MGDTIDVIGTGYIGSAIATVLLDRGYAVCGIDTDPSVVQGLEERDYEYPDVQSRLGDAIEEGRMTVSTDPDDMRGRTHLICVGTPTGDDGRMDGSDLMDACRSVGKQLADGDIVIVRSTVEPGTSEDRIIPALEDASGLTAGDGFSYCYQPEFLRGGTAIDDLREPEKTVFAGDREAIDRAREILPLGGRSFEVPLREAEAVKYLDNAFHALKVAFANEVLRWGDTEDIDAHRMMDVLKSDERLNISGAYLDPGYPFGGPCLEKDIQVIQHRNQDQEVPLLQGIRRSNADHLDWLHDRVRDELGSGTVGLLGLAYKTGAHSTVGSPALRLAERLEDDGYTVIGHDPHVTDTTVMQFDDPEDVNERADLLVVFNDEEAYTGLRDGDTTVIDLHDVTGPDGA